MNKKEKIVFNGQCYFAPHAEGVKISNPGTLCASLTGNIEDWDEDHNAGIDAWGQDSGGGIDSWTEGGSGINRFGDGGGF